MGILAITGLLVACGNDEPADDGAPQNDGTASISGVPTGNGLGSNNGTTCDGTVRGRVRDFKMTFPDMEPAHSGKSDNADDRGLVKKDIDPKSRKPIYAGGASGTVTTTGPANFDKWFRDSSNDNVGQDLPLAFSGPDAKGVYSYDNQKFFPIDGQLWGNEGKEHNFSFTFELHTAFQYKGGEQFTFIGDDDVFTFVNGKLVVDLGGVHEAETATVNIDSLGLTKGNTYPLDFFFAERHVTESHFRIDTSLEFVDCGEIYLQ
jgi:fibro-slime domain-containing protein